MEPAPRVERRGGWNRGTAKPGPRSHHKPKTPQRISVGPVGAGPGAPLRPEADGLGVAPAPAPATAPIDRETALALVNGLVGMLDELGQAMVERVAGTKTRDETFIREAGKRGSMSDRVKDLLRIGGVGCVMKYSVNFAYVEETALALGVGFWALGITAQVRALKRLPDVGPDLKAI